MWNLILIINNISQFEFKIKNYLKSDLMFNYFNKLENIYKLQG